VNTTFVRETYFVTYRFSLTEYQIIADCKLKLTPWSWALLEKLPTAQLLKNCPVFHGTRRFFTMFTGAHDGSLSWATWVQPTPTKSKIHYNIIISPTSRSFLPAFPSKSHIHSSLMRAICHAYIIFLYLIVLRRLLWTEIKNVNVYYKPHFIVVLETAVTSVSSLLLVLILQNVHTYIHTYIQEMKMKSLLSEVSVASPIHVSMYCDNPANLNTQNVSNKPRKSLLVCLFSMFIHS
jgi:hypothetical protein